jgi:hypothetical protein
MKSRDFVRRFAQICADLRFVLVLGILMTGGVLGANELTNVVGIDMPGDVVAGAEFVANFSFDYDAYTSHLANSNNSEFILQLNFTSSNESYPVWRGDFGVSGWVEKRSWFGWVRRVDFNCSDDAEQSIVFSYGQEDVEALNGTFFCYSEEGELTLNEEDDVFLEVISNVAIWPGEYNLTAGVYYLTDEYVPFVDILNDSYFDSYFGRNDKVDVWVNVSDRSDVVEVFGYGLSVYDNGSNLLFPSQFNGGSGVYEFQGDTGSEGLSEGDYDLVFYAEDESGNVGNDSVKLRFDLSAPVIELVSPVSSVYSEVVPFKLNVTDEKGGVDYDSVEVRLRQYVDGFGLCPATGGMVGGVDCVTTDWIGLDYNGTSGLFELSLNVSEVGLNSSEYWIDAVALDVLGNKAEWIEDD